MRKPLTLVEFYISKTNPEVYAQVCKAIDCKWFFGGDCKKGLPGTLCNIVGCVVWEQYKPKKK